MDAAVHDMLSLGTEVEVLRPPELRTLVRDAAVRIADRHTDERVVNARG
jgi:predicted DNA-binding transcriptional regulator YafY